MGALFFVMYSEDLFDKNFSNLLASNPSRSREDFIDYERARRLRDLSDGETEIKNWLDDPNRLISLPRFSPRNQDGYDNLEKLQLDFALGESIEQYLDIPDRDPHLLSYLLKQRQHLDSLSIDPFNNISIASPPINTLVTLGCGDGRALHYMLTHFQPYNLMILVPDWESYVSSFWFLDWDKIWNHFNTSESQSISIARYKDLLDARNILLSSSLLGLDHAYTYVPLSDMYSDLVQLRKDLSGPASHNAIHYLGFTLDEYNMVYNTITTIQAQPKLYSKPSFQSKGNCIVCGSGPSLDDCLDDIKKLADSHVIICGGSNYSTLRSHGIVPDYLVLVERANNTYDDYLLAEQQFGSSSTRLVMSSTCPVKLIELYPDTCIFFRPALTPLALFSQHMSEVLHFEGPESINGAFSFAESLGFDNIVLFGTDLGTSDINKPRSSKAAGLSPRSFPLKRPGNQIDEVFTSQNLIDTAEIISFCIKNYDQTTVYNCSNGIYIDGTVKSNPADYKNKFIDLKPFHKSRSLAAINQWWNSLDEFTSAKMQAIWESRNPRASTFNLSMQLKNLFLSDKPWIPTVVKELDTLLGLDCNVKDQIPRRIMRSTVYKASLSFTQQYYINKSLNLELQVDFEKKARASLSDTVSYLEKEIYLLCDLAESHFNY